MLLTKRLLLHRAIPNMVPFNLALEASDLGRILVDRGLVLGVGFESKSTLVIGGLLHTQHVVKCPLPFMTLSLDLELSSFLYMVSGNTSTRGGRCIIVRATRQGK